MEIERKYLINLEDLPADYDTYPFHEIEQGYLCTQPVVRIRKQDNEFFLTYKSKGLMVREEHNLPLTEDAYLHLRRKVDGCLIQKNRYCIPYDNNLTIELDIFMGYLAPLILAEVEFDTEEAANAFVPPHWFGEDVTFSQKYHNSTLSQANIIPPYIYE